MGMDNDHEWWRRVVAILRAALSHHRLFFGYIQDHAGELHLKEDVDYFAHSTRTRSFEQR